MRNVGHQFLQLGGVAQVAALDVQAGLRGQQAVEIGPATSLFR